MTVRSGRLISTLGVNPPTSLVNGSPGAGFRRRARSPRRDSGRIGANRTRLRGGSVRGVSLNGGEMTFTHANVTGPQCDSIVGAACTPYGVPTHEHDVIALRLALD